MARHESPDTPHPRIPASAAAIVDLLNSRSHATPPLPDALDDTRQSGAILGPFAPTGQDAPTPAQLDRVRALRGDLMAVLAADSPAETAQAWTAVTRRIADLTFQQVFAENGKPQLRQVAGDRLVGRIVLTVAELAAADTWSRIRICGNEMCSHVFYDATRSRTQRWHSYEMCGNRTNVAAYRARARGARDSDA